MFSVFWWVGVFLRANSSWFNYRKGGWHVQSHPRRWELYVGVGGFCCEIWKSWGLGQQQPWLQPAADVIKRGILTGKEGLQKLAWVARGHLCHSLVPSSMFVHPRNHSGLVSGVSIVSVAPCPALNRNWNETLQICVINCWELLDLLLPGCAAKLSILLEMHQSSSPVRKRTRNKAFCQVSIRRWSKFFCWNGHIGVNLKLTPLRSVKPSHTERREICPKMLSMVIPEDLHEDHHGEFLRSETLDWKKQLIKLQYVYKLNCNLEMVVVKTVVRIEPCSGVCAPWMIQKWYWEFETQPQNWATGWWVWQLRTSICRRDEWNAVS